MASWSEIERAAPDLAARARTAFDAGVNKTIATLRRDGSPRISAIELEFADGNLYVGSMWKALKALDLRRDPRFALHSPSCPEGDAKLAGRAVEITDPAEIERRNGGKAPPGPNHLFELDVDELSVVGIGDPPDHLVIELWTPAEGRRRIIRR